VKLSQAIEDMIKAEFPDIDIQSGDEDGDFVRPSFFVYLETTISDSRQFNVLKDVTCRIRYFPSNQNNYKEEAYDVQDRLETLFGQNLPVEGRILTIDTANTNIVEKVVQYNFEFSYYDDTACAEDDVDIELMQELHFES